MANALDYRYFETLGIWQYTLFNLHFCKKNLDDFTIINWLSIPLYKETFSPLKTWLYLQDTKFNNKFAHKLLRATLYKTLKVITPHFWLWYELNKNDANRNIIMIALRINCHVINSFNSFKIPKFTFAFDNTCLF